MRIEEENELVSIITPAYNCEKYISKSIDSVLNQTYKKWEMIIVNDKSLDNTQSIVEYYCEIDSRIKLINQKENLGVALARNAGLRVAHGRYIAFLDSDDCWKKDKLERQLDFMRENNAAFSYTSYELIDEEGKNLGKYIRSKPIITFSELIKNTLIGCLTVVIDKRETGSFEMPNIKHTEDTMTWYEILSRGFIAYGMSDILAEYRISSGSMTSNKIKAAKLQWLTYRNYCKFSFIKSTYYFCWYAYNALRKTKNR